MQYHGSHYRYVSLSTYHYPCFAACLLIKVFRKTVNFQTQFSGFQYLGVIREYIDSCNHSVQILVNAVMSAMGVIFSGTSDPNYSYQRNRSQADDWGGL